MNSFNTEEISRLIRFRRSVYPHQFTCEEIRKAVMDELLENANWAPTHKVTEPWRFTVFCGAGKTRLAEFMAGLYKTETSANGTFEEGKYKSLLSKPLEASHVIAIGMKRDPKERLPEIEEVEAVACAVQNMALTAAAHGLGAYWGTGGITYFESAKTFFDLGPADKLLGFMYLGIPKKVPAAGRRKPIEEKVRWIND